MNHNQIPSEILDQIYKDRLIRKEVTAKNFWLFNSIYFGHHITYTPAPFHHEIFNLIQDQSVEFLIIQAFRGSGKTTLINQFYPIWAILGEQKKKHVVILGQTLVQAKQHLRNIKSELETNELLKNDLGPFEEHDEWNSYSLVIPEHNARITAASAEQSIRGIKHGAHRPDLIILDDVEDINSVKTKESRDNIYRWVTGDVIPLGDKNTRIIIIGNLLHEDSLLMRLMNEIDSKQRLGIYRRYPLLDEDNNIMWPGKYPTMVDIKKEKMRVGNEIAWRREYLLQMVAEEDQIIKREWIKYYDELPDRDNEENEYRIAAIAVDLGVKQNQRSDPTAMVGGYAFGSGDNGRIYISPEFFNQKVSLLEITEKAKELSRRLNNGESRSRIIVEDVAAQNYVIQQIQSQGYFVDGFRPRGDKSERLTMISPLIQNGRVLFHPACEPIINQIVNLGIEKHDDLCDAFVMLVTVLIEIIGHQFDHLMDPDEMLKNDDWIMPDGTVLERIRYDSIF